MKKKLLAVTMLLALILCAVGCGKKEKKFALGKLENGKYTNSYIGASFEAGEPWDMSAATDSGEVDYEGAYQINDFQANNPDDMQSVNITFQHLTEEDRKELEGLSEKECVEKLIKEGGMESNYAQQGFTVNELAPKEVEFLGEKRVAVYLALEFFGMEFFILQLIDFKCGEYMPIITVESYYEDNTQSVLAMFKKYE